MCISVVFFVVSQINNNNCYTLYHPAKYGKNLDIYKQMAKSFLGFAFASLSLRRLRAKGKSRKGYRKYRKAVSCEP